MARAQDQKKWRDNSGKKCVEAYLPVDKVAALDAMASERGLSRAGMIGRLIDDQRHIEPTAPDSFDGTDQPASQSKGYSWRKAKGSKRYDWFVVVDGEPVAGVKKDDVNGWRGEYLNGSWVARWAKGKTRDKVACELLEVPEIYK